MPKLFKESLKETKIRYAQELQCGCRIDVRTGAYVPLTKKEIAYRMGFLQSNSKNFSDENNAYMQGIMKGRKAQRTAVRNAKYYSGELNSKGRIRRNKNVINAMQFDDDYIVFE